MTHDILDASIIEYCVHDAFGLFKASKELNRKTTIFGSKKSWIELNKGKITKEEFFEKRDSNPVVFIGKKGDPKGNRKFALNLSENEIIFKHNRNSHHKLKIKTSNKRLNDLKKLQLISENEKTPITYRLGKKFIYVMFDESVLNKEKHNFINNRIGSLDLNPNYIAFTVQDFPSNEIVHKQIFDLTSLNKSKNNNKIKFEVLEISKQISILAKHYKCEIVGLEQLTMKKKDLGKGKYLNRLINNTWKKQLFANNLKKRLNILGIKNQEINAAYSSTIGCINNPDETDSIGASLEIGRRTYVFLNRFLNKNKEFLDVDIMYPSYDLNKIKERWNSILSDFKSNSWKKLHEYLKEKNKLNELRFIFNNYNFNNWSSFSPKSYKSLVESKLYCFG